MTAEFASKYSSPPVNAEFALNGKYYTLKINMIYSKSFIKTQKETSKDADSISSALLTRGCFIDKEISGIYSILPLGEKVIQKIADIIREEMNHIGGQEISMPALQPKELWDESGRWNKMDPPLFKLKDRHDKELALGSTHEEVIVDLVRDRISSFKDLPQMLYQIQTKFRNEMRSTGGLLRVREFLMKDAYSFHSKEEDFNQYYQKVTEAYQKIFKRVGINARMVEANSGSIGGNKSNEFMLLSETGEDKVYLCGGCDWAANAELVTNIKKCPACGGEIKQSNAIEIAHIFMLGDLYSKKMAAAFTDTDGKNKHFIMGCYGIGIGRLMAAIVEANHDEAGIIWPESIAPANVYLAELKSGEGKRVCDELIKEGIEVLYDDRDVSAGVKFSDADLLGIPFRLVVSEKTGDKIEIKKRGDPPAGGESRVISLDKAIEELRK